MIRFGVWIPFIAFIAAVGVACSREKRSATGTSSAEPAAAAALKGCPFDVKEHEQDCKRAWANYQSWFDQNKCAQGKPDTESEFMDDCSKNSRVTYGCLELYAGCDELNSCEQACSE